MIKELYIFGQTCSPRTSLTKLSSSGLNIILLSIGRSKGSRKSSGKPITLNNSNIDKTSPDYIRLLTGNEELQSSADEQKLEAMVRQQLKDEFPNIENSKSYELLVDAVIHNYKKKQLQAMDEISE